MGGAESGPYVARTKWETPAIRCHVSLTSMHPAHVRSTRRLHEIPSALEHFDQVVRAAKGRSPALFIDFDGTLSPIVPQPGTASIDEPTRQRLRTSRSSMPVAVVSGRDLSDLRSRVGIDDLIYAGSHGLQIEGPQIEYVRGAELRPALDRARQRFEQLASRVPGTEVETKALGVALHYRRVSEELGSAAADGSAPEAIEAAVAEVLADESGLRLVRGKKVLELRPDVPWDKGSAVRWLLKRMVIDPSTTVPIYIGDDVTDEAAFKALDQDGISIVVRGEDDDRESVADYSLGGPRDVPPFLERLLELLTPR